MAFQFIPAAAAGLGKALAFAKGLAGGAKAVSAMGALGKSAKAAAAAKKFGLYGAKTGRAAGNALRDYMGGKVTPGALAENFGMDLFFGGMQGLQTPGDLGDKLIAGTTSAVGGALGGIGTVGIASKLGGKVPTGFGRQALEFGGGYLGDMAGQSMGDALMRLKGGGQTPYDRLRTSQDQEYRAQVERDILAAYGLGGYQPTDLFLRENDLEA